MPAQGMPHRPNMRVPAPQDDNESSMRVTTVVRRVLPQRAVTPPAGAVSIGRASQSGIVVPDALASRTHAFLTATPAGPEIRDNRSGNGTFVNGRRIEAALLHAGDVVTIGNTDLVFDGTTLAVRESTADSAGIGCYRVGLTVDDDKRLLEDVSFTARPGTLTAVIGPSGAGKSTLIRVLGGGNRPTTGWVSFDGHDVHAEYASLRSRIGVVPQDDVVHRQLTVKRALDYAAELRLPSDTTKADRDAVVTRVLDELELTGHRDKRIDTLSGGQRKRVSVAMELLTGPLLLILDEPTSGLDPALDRQVMAMLRRLADAGRVVVVVTHSLTYLRMCDQVLLLAPGGKTAYAGAPDDIAKATGTTDWADIFAWVAAEPEAAHQAFLARAGITAPPEPAAAGGAVGKPAQTSLRRQVWTVARRQARLIVADRGYFAFLTALPLVLGILALAVPGSTGLGEAKASGSAPAEPAQLLILLNIAAVFMGTALTIRDLVGERAVFRREQAVGLSASAYLGAKLLVYSLAAALQTAALLAIVVLGKGGPTQGATTVGNPVLELYLALTLTAVVSAIVGLLLSSLARSTEQVLPMLVVVIMLSIVFAGGMIPVTGRVGLTQLSWLMPARWGYAATASTVDLLTVAPLETSDDLLWYHTGKWWTLDMSMLAALGLAYLTMLRWRLRLPSYEITGGPAASENTGATSAAVKAARRRKVAGWGLAGCGIVAAVAMLATLTNVTSGSGTRAIAPIMRDQDDEEEEVLATYTADQLPDLLAPADSIASQMWSRAMADATPMPITEPHTTPSDPPQCAPAVYPASAVAYTKESGMQALVGQRIVDLDDPNRSVEQVVSAFASADDAAMFQDRQLSAWRRCENTTVSMANSAGEPAAANLGSALSEDGRATLSLLVGAQVCQRALEARSNVVIDVRTCAPAPGNQASAIASLISGQIT
ncbi:ATP-binding cassette domain-containing protein [Mycolicibacterium brumae]|nr:ATP-binding cassette domain-containing protein [Mycolicibacterium brumae]